jgi:hypothetical protein
VEAGEADAPLDPSEGAEGKTVRVLIGVCLTSVLAVAGLAFVDSARNAGGLAWAWYTCCV